MNMGAGTGSYKSSFEGKGQIVWAASCTATSEASIRGSWKITDNASGAVVETLADDQSGIDDIKVVTDEQGNHVVSGTVGSGSTTTTVATGLTTVTDQFNGKVVTFSEDTTTVALRGQSTSVSGTDGSGNLTVVAITNAPVNGDTFVLT